MKFQWTFLSALIHVIPTIVSKVRADLFDFSIDVNVKFTYTINEIIESFFHMFFNIIDHHRNIILICDWRYWQPAWNLKQLLIFFIDLVYFSKDNFLQVFSVCLLNISKCGLIILRQKMVLLLLGVLNEWVLFRSISKTWINLSLTWHFEWMLIKLYCVLF